MRFSTTIIALAFATAYAAPVNPDTNELPTTNTNLEEISTRGVTSSASNTELEERQVAIVGALITILTPGATAAANKIAIAAINATGKLITSMRDWTETRETFTKTVTKDMYANKPAEYLGVVCCNGDYSNSGGISEVTKARLHTSLLHTDYDCFFTKKGNVFKNKGDGGFINIATYGCSWSKGTLTC